MDYSWNYMPNLKTAIYFYFHYYFIRDMPELSTETRFLSIFVGVVSVLFIFLYIFA